MYPAEKKRRARACRVLRNAIQHQHGDGMAGRMRIKDPEISIGLPVIAPPQGYLRRLFRRCGLL